MSVFFSSFEYFKTISAGFASDLPLSQWGEGLDLQALAEQLATVSEDAFLEASSSVAAADAVDTPVDDVAGYSGDIHSGMFGTTGGDGDSFYYFDPESGASVML